ncbi:DUF4157 domain-containing protein [Pedobacter agri]|uniref:eCIS core domain-containing protein n=1 Tax=Pedobacter agri TaxID=454586 RepID=UPI00292CF49A|nr:DUF4157 domain-containing protein [Pedobacter agri]
MGAALAYGNPSFKSVTHNRPGASCVQAKLKIGAVNDPQEKQADQVAEKVMRMPSNAGFVMGGIGSGAAMNVQRQCKNCENEEKISRKEEELKGIDQPEILQAKAGTSFANGGTAPGTVQSGIASTKGAGSNLPAHVNSDLGGKMGADFSSVRIHDNAHAAKMTAHVNARAFTVGNDIYFNQGEYNPNSSSGKFLLAHELTHTIQQGATVQRKTEEKEKVLRKVDAPEKIDRCACGDEKVQRWDLGDWLAESAWEIVEEIAPAAFVQLLREISSKGILGFLREKLMTSLNLLFDRFPAVGNFVTNLISVFSLLYERVSVIMQALISGDCAPLLAAVTELKNVITTIATDAWAGLTDFVRPIGDFFSGLWSSFGAPVVDWLGQTASDVWAWMQGIGQSIWDWTSPVREYGAMAWDWVKSTLGIGADSSGAENSNGILQWVTGKAEEAWTGIKETIRPVIEPVQQIATRVMDILPLTAIMNLRDSVSNFASGVNGMASAMGDDGSGIAAQAQQASLRDVILPAVQTKIVEVQQGISNTGLWIAENVGGFVNQITGFYSSVASNSIFSAAAPAIAWINDTALSLSNWVQTGVVSLFSMASDGLGYLAGFINPILNALQRIVDTLSDLAGRAGDFILGPFMLIPECIRTPIKNFLIAQILSRIPLFSQIMAIGDVWARAQQIVMTILYQVFVDGNLPGAMWTFFRELLSLVGIPPELVVSILANASQAVVDILGNPVGFFINLLSGLQQGFTQFFGNIGTHLLSGVVNWLTAEMQAMGITPPTDFSFGSIFSFILQILGITIDNIFNLLATRIGEERAQRLRGMLDMATGAWSFVADVVERGPAAIWERIQEQLSNLWDTVIGNIVTFINERIMAQATAWLLSMLDISGIMPVVNSILAVYRAIQSFTEYFVPILRIINQYVTMLADVARGNIAGAANFLEGILANSLPIMIGFLANQFGFGRIATRMQEILESVKARIDAGILWVIDQAIRIGGTIMDAGRSVRDAVLGWWNRRRSFVASDGQHHEMYYQGEGRAAELYVASSNPRPANLLITQLQAQYDAETTGTGAVKKQKAAEARVLYDTQITPLLMNVKSLSDDQAQENLIEQNPNYQQLLVKEVELMDILREIMGNASLADIRTRYLYEGAVGTYTGVPTPTYDSVTPDHQPQCATLKAAAEMVFGPTREDVFLANNPIFQLTNGSHCSGAFVINLHSNRHNFGVSRTYGTTPHTSNFVTRTRPRLAMAPTRNAAQQIVVSELRSELNADVSAIQSNVLQMPISGGEKRVWRDIDADDMNGLTLNLQDKTSLYNFVKANITQGERQMANQPLNNLIT